MKVLLEQIGSHGCPLLTARRDATMFGEFSADAQFPHE
jgi:hypothetical protein